LFQPLLYQVAIEPPANEIGDIGLEIRERRDEVGPQGEDLVGIRLGKALTRGFSRRARGGRTT
jgi:hypothetical protein